PSSNSVVDLVETGTGGFGYARRAGRTNRIRPPTRARAFRRPRDEEVDVGVLPPEVEEVVNAALVAELTGLDERGRPVTHPLIPLYDGEKILMTSSVLFSKKLERIKANPHVSVSVTDPVSAVGVERFRRITVQGDATVADDDLHSGWERSVLPLWRVKEPA